MSQKRGEMRTIRMVVSDLDGTLINSEGVITPWTRKEMRRIEAHGVHFAIASGRPSNLILRALNGVPLSLPTISCNGAIVEDVNTGEIVDSTIMDVEIAKRVMAMVNTIDLYWAFVVTVDGWMYRPMGRPDHDQLIGMVAEAEATFVDDWGIALDSTCRILKILLYGDEYELRSQEDAFRRLDGVVVTSSRPGNREIMMAGVDKSVAANKLAEKLRIRPENVLAIGDSYNDLQLIEWAGTGVAMGNAIPELKQAADWVTTSNDEDGVATALSRFVR